MLISLSKVPENYIQYGFIHTDTSVQTMKPSQIKKPSINLDDS